MSITQGADRSVLHHPLSGTTPYQRQLASERRLRMQQYFPPQKNIVARDVQPEPVAPQPEPVPTKSLFEFWMEEKFDPNAPVMSMTKILKGIKLAVLDHFPDVTLADLVSVRRNSDIVRARQLVYYITKKRTDWSLPRIGRLLGGRDHTTVLHGIKKIEFLCSCCPEVAFLVADIEAALNATPKQREETSSATCVP